MLYLQKLDMSFLAKASVKTQGVLRWQAAIVGGGTAVASCIATAPFQGLLAGPDLHDIPSLQPHSLVLEV